MIVLLVWAGVVLVGLMLAYLVATKALDQRQFELRVADDIRHNLAERLAEQERRRTAESEAVGAAERAIAALDERLVVVEQRTDPHLARGGRVR